MTWGEGAEKALGPITKGKQHNPSDGLRSKQVVFRLVSFQWGLEIAYSVEFLLKPEVLNGYPSLLLDGKKCERVCVWRQGIKLYH